MNALRFALRTVVAGGAAAALSMAACSEDGPSIPAIPEGAVQYHAHVRPIFESRCASCHHSGGIAPFSMQYDANEWSTGAPAWVANALDAIDDGRMPPWLPSEGCRDLAYERRLTDVEKSTIAEWKNQGFVEGHPATYPGPAKVDAPAALGKASLEVKPLEAYAPRADLTDDYRCFVLPQQFDTETYLSASTIVPGNTEIVHHALLFLIQPALVPTIEKLDSDEAGPGYTCFGGPGGGALTTLGAWVPGSVTIPTEPGSAFVIPKGARIVLQMHYNTIALNGAEPPEERSTVQLWTSTTKPANRIELLPLAHLALAIDANDPASVQERVFRMPTDGTIVSFGPHMHLLGHSIRAELASGADPSPEDACLIDIPKWDFHWQQSYPLTSETALQVKKNDALRVTCTYDNSAANQPLVDGMTKVSTDVWWGEGTLDEMCLLFVGMKVPFDTPDFRCGAYPECVKSCADGDGACFFDCSTVGGAQCPNCLIRAVGKCAAPYCAQTGVAFQQCMATCTEDASGCVLRECAAEFDAFYACMEPHLESGDCAKPLAECGL